MQSSTGTVLRQTRLTESSLIVHWLTVEEGLVKTVARGARRGKGGLSGRIDLFLEGEIVWNRARAGKGDLGMLKEVSVIDYRLPLRESYRRTLVAGYFCQLLEGVLEPDHPVPELYDLLQRGLGWLTSDEMENQGRRGLFHFEKELGNLLGLGKSGASGIVEAFGGLPKSRNHCLDLLS